MNDAPNLIKKTEETSSVASELFERIRNPFLAGFVIAWCIINHKFLLIYFSEIPIDWKFIKIEKLYDHKEFYTWWKLLIAPTLSTLLLRFFGHIYKLIDSIFSYLISSATRKVNEATHPDYNELLRILSETQANLRNGEGKNKDLHKRIEEITEQNSKTIIENENLKRVMAIHSERHNEFKKEYVSLLNVISFINNHSKKSIKNHSSKLLLSGQPEEILDHAKQRNSEMMDELTKDDIISTLEKLVHDMQ